MKTILKYLEKYYKRMTLGLIIKIVGTLFELLLPYILSYILFQYFIILCIVKNR